MGFCPQPVCVVKEHCAEGSLDSVLRKVTKGGKNCQKLPWPSRVKMAADIAQVRMPS